MLRFFSSLFRIIFLQVFFKYICYLTELHSIFIKREYRQVFANWGFSVLLEGKARVKEIWILLNYSLVPYTVFSFLYVLISNIATQEEGTLLSVLLWIGIGWSGFLLLRALMAYQEFSFGGAIGSVLLTVIGVVIILFLLVLLISLFQKIFATASIIFYEISFRLK